MQINPQVMKENYQARKPYSITKNKFVKWLHTSYGRAAAGLASLAIIVLIIFKFNVVKKVQALADVSNESNSGLVASFTLIFLSELGDKTFFIAALLAAKLGNMVSFVGTMVSLSLMTLVSVAIGVIFSTVPHMIHTSAPIGQIIGAILLVWFGFRSLKEGLKPDEPSEGGGGELEEAQEALQTAEQQGKVSSMGKGLVSRWRSVVQVGVLVFVAEWGDRSMLATIALGASQSPMGVIFGAVAGHAVATVLAVVGGALASQYISERLISIIGGVCFLIFALLTGLSLLGVFGDTHAVGGPGEAGTQSVGAA